MFIFVGIIFLFQIFLNSKNYVSGLFPDLYYQPAIPALAHRYLNGTDGAAEKLQPFAEQQDAISNLGQNLTEFSTYYIDHLGKAYHWAFGVACLSLVVSMVVFWAFRKYYKGIDLTEKQKAKSVEHRDKMIHLTPKQTKDRLIALLLIFFVAIFFWMAFHQNGATMTAFARDYTVTSVDKYTNIWFDLFGLLPIFLALLGLIFVFRKKSTQGQKIAGAIGFVVFAFLAYLRIEGSEALGVEGYSPNNPFNPEKFQHFNPFFIVALTPIVVGLFTWLRKKGKEPSAPKKIGIGIVITALAFITMVVGSITLIGASPYALNETRVAESMAVGPYWLISTYFTLTIAELFLSQWHFHLYQRFHLQNTKV